MTTSCGKLVKSCSGCGESDPAKFSISSYTKRPYPCCRECRRLEYKKRLAAMPEEKYLAMKENEKRWREKNPERLKVYWATANAKRRGVAV